MALRQRSFRTEEGTFVNEEDVSGEQGNDMKELVLEMLREMLQNCISVFGLAFFIVCYAKVFLFVSIMDPGKALYLLVAVVGLTIFTVGLRRGLMPLGEQVGTELPAAQSRTVVLVVIFCLGVLCTIAEPAIGALQQAGQNITPARAPLLAIILSKPNVLMVIVGVGVGCAAVFGCVRLIYDVQIKPCLFVLCCPAIAITLLCVFIGRAYQRAEENNVYQTVTGLAWDCGAVTTGPVTVPIVLALGIGVSASAKAQKMKGVASVNQAADARIEYDSIRKSLRDNSMIKGIDPVNGRNSALNHVSEGVSEDDLSGFGIVTFASLMPVISVWGLGKCLGGTSVVRDNDLVKHQGDDGNQNEFLNAMQATCQAVLPLVGFLLAVQVLLVRRPLANKQVMMQGLGFCFVGMFLFTIGLTGALVPLGRDAGMALKNAVDEKKGWGVIGGPLVILIFGFLSGAIATFAEPALGALGETVEKLTNGKYSKMKLILAVAIGVGFGIALGMAKVYYELPLWIIILVSYVVCLAMTTKSSEVVASIAWDSAGVTTGPVTVPIVLASGLALGSAAGVAEGFGILSCASIGPIFMVLLSGLLMGDAEELPAPTAGGPSKGEILMREVQTLPPTSTPTRDTSEGNA